MHVHHHIAQLLIAEMTIELRSEAAAVRATGSMVKPQAARPLPQRPRPAIAPRASAQR